MPLLHFERITDELYDVAHTLRDYAQVGTLEVDGLFELWIFYPDASWTGGFTSIEMKEIIDKIAYLEGKS